MVGQKILVSLFLAFSFLAGTTIAKTEFITYSCSNSGNYTKTSVFQTNLETALSFNTTNVNYGFYNFSDDWNADRLDVIGLCRGDVKPSSCRSCLNESSDNLRQLCPNQKEAIGWAELCMIRYANRSILHKNETSPALYMYNLNNASDPARFNKAVSGLLDNLQAKAAAGGPMLKYATGETNSTRSSEKIFGLVQCTPDLSPEQCSNCLNGALTVLPRCCDGKIGGRVLSPSCNFRYETNRFYGQTPMSNAPAPAPQVDSPAPAPQVAAPAPPRSNGQTATTPISTTPGGESSPPPPPQGGGNRNLGSFSLATVTTAVTAILML